MAGDDDDNDKGDVDAGCSCSARGRAFVNTFEIVDASHWTFDGDGAIHDLRPLLLMMDIGSCASAEKHTGVNCVTASMGDVVIEHYPRIGELLELRASPVSVGRTSLNIAVAVYVHGCEDTKSKSNDDGGDDDIDGTRPSKRVCEAFFTYVTTRGPDGGKRYAPPLEPDGTTSTATAADNNNNNNNNSSSSNYHYSSDTTWERTLARFRKQLIRSEQSTTRNPANYTIPRSEAIFETSEVVLPSHQNHMAHLFGGVVMGWMCNAVRAACVQATGLPPIRFKIRAIQRVDFPEGADVKDHVFLRPRITAIFERGRSAELEVMVGKRRVTEDNTNNAIAIGKETTMNVGYFYVSGAEDTTGNTNNNSNNSNSNSDQTKKLSTRIAPFARLLKSRPELGAGESSSGVLCTNTNETTIARAHKRKSAMLARLHLLTGSGDPITWDSSLHVQAPILTILSVLRLCERSSETPASSSGSGTKSSWMPIATDHGGNIEWTTGDSLGQHKTIILRGKTVITRSKDPGSSGSGSSGFLEDVVGTLQHLRSLWDPTCVSVTILEQEIDDESAIQKDNDGVHWDIAEYDMRAKPDIHTKVCLLRATSYIGADGSLLPGRASSIRNSNTSGCVPKSAVIAARSVRHELSASANRILPSGWLAKVLDDDGYNESVERIEITYVSQHDLDVHRELRNFGNAEVTDDYMVCFLASIISMWFANLAQFDHRMTV